LIQYNARAQLLSPLIGRPWVANAPGPDAFDCWSLVVYLQRELFGRTLPDVSVPEDPSWTWIIEQFAAHGERSRWREVPRHATGLVIAPDGSIVLMAHVTRLAHAGVWLAPEHRVVHADQEQGVSVEDVATLAARGWRRIVVFAPA
jgi:cell wall-associated NlpC family hydrolase